MAVIFIPSTPIPTTELGFESAFWYATYDTPIRLPQVLEPGATVYLYDGVEDILRWEGEVSDILARPFEHVDQWRDLLEERWGLWATPVDGTAPSPGFGVAFKLKAIEQISRPMPPDAAPLRAWETTCSMDDEMRRAWGLPKDPCGLCHDEAA